MLARTQVTAASAVGRVPEPAAAPETVTVVDTLPVTTIEDGSIMATVTLSPHAEPAVKAVPSQYPIEWKVATS